MRPSLSPAALAAAASLCLAACGGESPAADGAAADTAGRTSTSGAAGVAASTSATGTAAATAAPTAAVVVLYNHPRDTAAFEKYYRDTHVPLVGQRASEIGLSRAVFMKFDRTADGKRPPYYRKAELWFPSEDALKRGMESAGMKAVVDDLPRFVTNGGPTVLVSHETNNP